MHDISKHDRPCEERIAEHLEGRVADFAALRDLAQVSDDAELHTLLEDRATRALYSEFDSPTLDALRENAEERIVEYPLCVSVQTVFRVDLSTGGPADYLEVFASGNTPLYEPAGNGEHYEVERIVYHFADWFDHAERELTGFEFDAAEAFASRVIPELVG